jgi:hypothetical protein
METVYIETGIAALAGLPMWGTQPSENSATFEFISGAPRRANGHGIKPGDWR